MADGRHFENRKYAITWPQIVQSSPWWRRYRHKFDFSQKLQKYKIQDGGRPPFRKSKIRYNSAVHHPTQYNMASRGFVSISWASCLHVPQSQQENDFVIKWAYIVHISRHVNPGFHKTKSEPQKGQNFGDLAALKLICQSRKQKQSPLKSTNHQQGFRISSYRQHKHAFK